MDVGKLAHSHSQPGGMDRTPPGTPKKGGKMLAVRVQMLDDTVTMFQVQAKALGRVLFDQVCNQLNLLESDYFGLEYQEAGGTKYWLDLEKPLCRQIGLSLVDTLVRFCVKFYTPDPSQLEEEFTRYLFCLQIKRDLSQGLLQCNSNTAALMASYIVQAECGDYVVEDYPDHRYLSSYKFVPNQDQELERRIMENHKKHAGQSPAEADLNLLETARRCELYGIKMHPAKDHEGCPLNLAVAHMGIVVFQNFSKINTFSWAKIRKISFKRKRFLVKLHPEGYGYYKDTVEFFFEGRNECKNFWKKCVENHGFFRCTMVKKVPRQKTRVLSRGSSFRYSGRTQKQIVDFVRENYMKRQTFQRSQSFRHSSSAHSSVANVGTSISAHPLLPLGDNAVAGTPASLSCGSMTLTSSPVHTADIHAGASPSPPLTTSVSPGTSVTSSPQHFYPQETPYRRAGHRPTKVKHPPVRSHRAISPLLSPTDAATAASNRSANHSNNETAVDRSEIINSRNSLKSPEFIDFNDVYSNCYTSLRSLGNPLENKIVDEEKKIDVFNVPYNFLGASSKSNESIKSLSKKPKTPLSGNDTDVDVDGYTWHRSASCKELYHEAVNAIENEKDKALLTGLETSYEIGVVPSLNRYEKSMRKCYSAVASKNPSIDRTGDVRNDMRIYSSSYPGTASSLSTESAEGEPEDPIAGVLDVKYDSQEEIALSHDDVSHDSYELLERELYDYNDESLRNKRNRIIGDSERTRSCSWGSDMGVVSPLDFRSFENIVVSGVDISGREQNLWSLEREKNIKHKSEIDFRSFNDHTSKGLRQAPYTFEEKNYDGIEKGRTPDFLDYDDRFGKRSREVDEQIFEMEDEANQLEKRVYNSKGLGDVELNKGICQEGKVRRASREEKENSDVFNRKKNQSRRKSLEELLSQECIKEASGRMEERRRIEKKREKRERGERFHEGLKEKEQKEWEKEKERRQMDRRKSMEEKELREEEAARKIMPKTRDYVNFQEIHFKKFERVVSNQFGKYPEFLTLERNPYDFYAQEKKVMENYEKVCQVSKLAKEMKKNEKNNVTMDAHPDKHQENVRKMSKRNGDFEDSTEFHEWKNAVIDLTTGSKVGRAHVERTRSDPFNSLKIQKRNILMHQKSIDLTPQHSEETTSDYDNEDALKKASRSEHDIPYILHKRHCMNGTAKNSDAIFYKTSFKSSFGSESAQEEMKSVLLAIESKKSVAPDASNVPTLKPKPSSAKVAEAKRAGVQIINLDTKSDRTPVSFVESRKGIKSSKPSTGKKNLMSDIKPVIPSHKTTPKGDAKNAERLFEETSIASKIKSETTSVESTKIDRPATFAQSEESEEPIYAEVCPEKILDDINSMTSQKNIPPNPPARSSSVLLKPCPEENTNKSEKSTAVKKPSLTEKLEKNAKLPLSDRPSTLTALEEIDKKETKPVECGVANDFKAAKDGKAEGGVKGQSGSGRGKQEASLSTSVHQRREDSLTLFARTRLGLSEGSAFAPIVRQGRVGSPSTQRRAKSLDAPYVSVHSLPPADAFSSKDDTLEGNESDIVDSAVAKFVEFCKGDPKKRRLINSGVRQLVSDPPPNTESEVDSVFTDDLEMEINFKKTVESQSKVEISCPEEKVLDGVRGKRLLSKIESVDFIDSEGDLDSSKVAERPPIPSDRLVNLPESIRFPSVRQISGQTSEESADGWDQKEVKVKRRTPRRSVGREEQDPRSKESVVWDSKDDEPQDDDVWDDSLAPTSSIGLPAEYLKRGSCGQSIDDDNLSTPMKESSPEHWVSVDDLPEALEREEKLLKQQEKILREKILNEKLKRELNLDTIDVDERYCDYRDRTKQCKFEEESTSLKESFKGHSLDTYELNEKKLRDRGNNKNSSLDEELLPNKLIDTFGGIDVKEKLPLKPSSYQEGLDYIQCKVVKDVAEIDQFGDNDEELEEFFVVLDENLGKEGRNMIWDDDDSYRRTLSIDESLISVPEEFKDEEREDESPRTGEHAVVEGDGTGRVEIRLNEVQNKRGKTPEEGRTPVDLLLQKKLNSLAGLTYEDVSEEGVTSEDFRSNMAAVDVGRLSPFDGSRRGSEENRKLSLSEDTGRLSPYDSSRRSSDDPRRCSASDDVDRLSPFSDSRRELEDPRRLSTSEDSRKCSASESVSEETRRRLSSTEETRRKRASLTKQCSVGAESLSDEVISGIQECSSSFEHDEKDVFEPDTVNVKPDEAADFPTSEMKNHKAPIVKRGEEQTSRVKRSEIEVSEDASNLKEIPTCKKNGETTSHINGAIHLAPPASERELSRETEDSVDYGEGDFKDIRDMVKEKDISEGLISDVEPVIPGAKKLSNSFEKSESSEGDELRYIDDKRGSTPEILIGKSREAVTMSIVVVNEGISVLNKISTKCNEKIGSLDSDEVAKTQSLSRNSEVIGEDKGTSSEGQRHTLPKTLSKPKPLTPKPVDYVHKKLTKTVPEIKVKTVFSPGEENLNKDSINLLKSSLDSSQESDLDRLSDFSLVSHVQNQIARRNLSDAGKCLRRNELGGVANTGSDSRKTSLEEESRKISSEEREKNENSSSELKSSADELVFSEEGKWTDSKGEKAAGLKPSLETRKSRREGNLTGGKEKRSPEQEKRDSGEDGSSSSSAPPCPKRELSSTWKPFLLESSGSSSLEEGWLPPDENAHLADEEETSSTSNNQQDDSCHDDLDYPTGIGYPVLNGEMMVGGYGSVFALSRTLSRISERSTSEQERSDVEDDITKPSSRSVSVEEESILSSDHQPSLSSDPPSPKESSSTIPDLPVDKPVIPQPFETSVDVTVVHEPFEYAIPPPLPEADWPSPPSSFGGVDAPVLSHVETFYMEIHPEEACKVVVAGAHGGDNSSSDENQTLQEESEFLHLSSDNMSASTTTTTQEGTVVIPVRPTTGRTGSLSEDVSMVSTSEWSSPTFGKSRPSFEEDVPEQTRSTELGKDISETSVDLKENRNVFSSTPLQNGKINGDIDKGEESEVSKSLSLTPLKNRTNNSNELSEADFKDQNSNKVQTKGGDPCLGRNTLDSKLTIDNNRNAIDGILGESEAKKKRCNVDKGYFIIKELLSTERTYKKDLDVVNVWFHEEVSKSEEEMPDDVLNGLFNLFDPLSAAHSQFLRDLEQRLATWEGKSNPLLKRDVQKVGDVILNHFNVLPLYIKYLDKHLLVLERLDAAFRKNKKFEQVYRDFELQRVCYLPLSSFIMKPLQRLLHYNSLIKRLLNHYGPEHVDYRDFTLAQNKLEPILRNAPSTLKVSANFIQLSELQRDMPGFEGLLQGGREFIRQGCLLKHSKKGFQQRMFFLFSDTLVYTNRTTTPSLQFKVNGQMPLRGVMVEESEDRMGTNFSFTIYGGNRTLSVAASSQEEKDNWLLDLLAAVQNAKEKNDGKSFQYLSLKSCSSSDEIMDKVGEDGSSSRNRNSQQRSNTTVHVCWHRNTSTSLQDHLRAYENELSGFLLRKFKNSNGWQKLWVVFTNFCLFFYKAYMDESPLACLPLLGYSVSVPDEEDEIRKDYVFKLQFKNHVYFFRAESDYTFSRWMEVIGSATKNSSMKQLIYKDSS